MFVLCFASLCCDFRLYIVFHIFVLCFTYLYCVLHICVVFCMSVLCFVCLCCILYVCVVFCTCGPPCKTALMTALKCFKPNNEQ